jgi:5-methyltetrahydropteroyltriglutamate--homocysteine methyltransferase
MRRSTDRIITTHPGRLPDPPNRDAVMAARAAGDQETFDRLVREGVAPILQKQQSLGVDVMSDGEFWKARDAKYYNTRVSGIEAVPLQPGEPVSTVATHRERSMPEFAEMWSLWDQVGNAPRPGIVNPRPTEKYVMTGPVKAKDAAPIKHEIELIKSILQDNGVAMDQFFYPVLGPGWLDHFVWDGYYNNEEEYCQALAEIVKADFHAVIDASFDLQVDDPGLNDRWGMINPAVSIDEYRRQEAIRIEATNWALQGIPEDRVRYHTCWGSWHTPHVTDIPFEHTVDLMLRVNAVAYSIEAADVRHEYDYKVFESGKARLPDGKIYIPGVVAHKTTTIEPVELVADRIVRYANLFGRENVIACVDCGVGGRAYPDIGWAKLGVLAEGAALATKMLWK